jgi:hypothetical protein
VNKAALKPTTRVALDMTTLTIMRALPRHVCALCTAAIAFVGLARLLANIELCACVGHIPMGFWSLDGHDLLGESPTQEGSML